MRLAEPEPTANGVSFLVYENALVWKVEHSGISFSSDLQVKTRKTQTKLTLQVMFENVFENKLGVLSENE